MARVDGDMLDSFGRGAIAGYAIAIPVGVIAILILETALQRGFWHGWAAGSGAATADLIYATLAAAFGTIVAQWLAPIAPLLKIVSAAFLLALGARGLYQTWKMRRNRAELRGAEINAGIGKTFATLLGLTLLNPATIAYFAALILGGTVGATPTLADKIAFVLGAWLASWSWQSLLAGIGAFAHRRLSPSFRVWASGVGNCVIMALGVVILL